MRTPPRRHPSRAPGPLSPPPRRPSPARPSAGAPGKGKLRPQQPTRPVGRWDRAARPQRGRCTHPLARDPPPAHGRATPRRRRVIPLPSIGPVAETTPFRTLTKRKLFFFFNSGPSVLRPPPPPPEPVHNVLSGSNPFCSTLVNC